MSDSVEDLRCNDSCAPDLRIQTVFSVKPQNDCCSHFKSNALNTENISLIFIALEC